MRIFAILLAITCASSLVAQQPDVADAVFSAALDNSSLGADTGARSNRPAIRGVVVIARRTIGGAPVGYRHFVDKNFGSVIGEELLHSYGDSGPASRTINDATAGGFSVLPLEEFETGTFDYDWQRLNQKYPNVRFVVRLSWPAVDRLGTYAVVRYELIGRDRPSTLRPQNQPWQHASFVKFEKQSDGSWKQTIAELGSIWK